MICSLRSTVYDLRSKNYNGLFHPRGQILVPVDVGPTLDVLLVGGARVGKAQVVFYFLGRHGLIEGVRGLAGDKEGEGTIAVLEELLR